MQTMSTAWGATGQQDTMTMRRAQPAEPMVRADQVMPSPHTPLLHFDGRTAWLMQLVPAPVYHSVLAANKLQGKPYKWGGGHRNFYDSGYDCSGSASHVLISAGLLRTPMTARDFMRYGEPGPGRYITIYAREGHVFMEICGLRFDTSGVSPSAPKGIFWRTTPRNTDGWAVRHPKGF